MLKNILIAVAIVIVGFLVFVQTRPSEFRVERSATIAAAPAALFAQVNDLHKWEAWDPWAKLDPNSKTTFEGPAEGVGSSFSWAGNNEVGEGKMTILESKPNELVKMKLEFFKPFAGTSTAEFTFKPEGDKTVVTWAMYGPNGYMGKLMGCFMDCEKMMGPKFEEGLANLKKIAEAQPAPAT